jgi:hypothetical protein
VILFSTTRSGNLIQYGKNVKVIFYQVVFGRRLHGAKLFPHENNKAKIYFSVGEIVLCFVYFFGGLESVGHSFVFLCRPFLYF